MPERTIAVLGLGHMGHAMAQCLLRAGFRVRAWNRTSGRIGPAPNVEVCATPREAVRDLDIVLTSLADDEAVRAVALGRDGFLEGMKPGAVHANTSTISWALAQELVGLHSHRGMHYVGAPVLGRPEAALAGELWILAGGEPDAIHRLEPVFETLGQGTIPVDTAPRAHLTKIIANLMIASTIEVLGEAMALGEKGGIAPATLVDILGRTIVGSPVLKSYGARISHGEFEPAGFRLELGLKDIALALDAATELRAPLPVASLLRDHMLEGIARGRGQKDWAVLAMTARDAAGLSTEPS